MGSIIIKTAVQLQADIDAAETAAEDALLDVLAVDKREIMSDSEDQAVATYTSRTDVAFIVDGSVYVVAPVDRVATLEVSADAPGAIVISARGKQEVVIAVEVPV